MSPELIRDTHESDLTLDQEEIDRRFRIAAQRYHEDPTLQFDRPHFDDDDVIPDQPRPLRLPPYMLGHMGIGQEAQRQVPEEKPRIRVIGIAKVVYPPTMYSIDRAPSVTLPTDYNSVPPAPPQLEAEPDHPSKGRRFYRQRLPDIPQPYGAESQMGREIRSHRRKRVRLLGRLATAIKTLAKGPAPATYHLEDYRLEEETV